MTSSSGSESDVMEDKQTNRGRNKMLKNPFNVRGQCCDIAVKVKSGVSQGDEGEDDHVIYLHTKILSLYSTVFESMLNDNDVSETEGCFKAICLDDVNFESVVELFKYFYPDQLQVTNEETNFEELLKLTQKYHVAWLTDHFEDFLINTASQDRLYMCSKNIRSLQLADRFDLKALRAKLLSYKSYESFKELQKIDGFQYLESSTMYEIAKIRIRAQLENKADECNAIIKQLDEIFYEKEAPHIIPIQTVFTKSKHVENPFSKPVKNTDVVVKVENYELFLHSAVLSLYSPVFQAMLDGKFKEGITKEVHLKEKQAEHVIEMFRYLYANQFQKLHAHTNFKELLALCDEYQISWLTTHVEDYLVSKVFAKGYDDSKNIWGLYLADRFQLNILRAKLLTFEFSSYSKLQMHNGFPLLANDTKYEIAKQRIKSIFPKVETQQYNIYSKNYVTRWVKSEECNAVIHFLDGLFLQKDLAIRNEN